MHVLPSTYRPDGATAPRRIGLLSTYPPRLCGLATYAHALTAQFERDGHDVEVVAVHESLAASAIDAVHRPVLIGGSSRSQRETVSTLNGCDVVLVQHEFGIFSGPDGADVLDVLNDLTVPVVITLHTVPLRPTHGQRAVLAALTRLAVRLVVMTDTARDRLVRLYGVDDSHVEVILHGAALAPSLRSVAPDSDARGPLLTWGLLGPGKGIEHVIDALALLRHRTDVPRYVVAGVTHPKVLERDGPAYLDGLAARAERHGLGVGVRFDTTYRDVGALTRFASAASLVVLPYDARDQVTSGVLVDAIAAGRPVIATGFPHATELLSSGAGIVVPHEDPAALADALARVLDDPALLASMAAEARRLAPSYAWSAVTRHHADLLDQVGTKQELSAT